MFLFDKKFHLDLKFNSLLYARHKHCRENIINTYCTTHTLLVRVSSEVSSTNTTCEKIMKTA